MVEKTAMMNKDYELDFVNTDVNSDMYSLRIYMRRNNAETDKHYLIKLSLISSILAYPALEMEWKFKDNEYEIASSTFHRICNEVDDVKMDFDRSMAPVATLAAKVREAVKPISISRQLKYAILPVDETNQMLLSSDWRMSLYSGRYPHMSREEKQKIQKFEGNDVETMTRKQYGLREKY